ncbi:MAG: hypothetical protein ACPL3C_06015 [Pyrobaculum sp.]
MSCVSPVSMRCPQSVNVTPSSPATFTVELQATADTTVTLRSTDSAVKGGLTTSIKRGETRSFQFSVSWEVKGDFEIQAVVNGNVVARCTVHPTKSCGDAECVPIYACSGTIVAYGCGLGADRVCCKRAPTPTPTPTWPAPTPSPTPTVRPTPTQTPTPTPSPTPTCPSGYTRVGSIWDCIGIYCSRLDLGGVICCKCTQPTPTPSPTPTQTPTPTVSPTPIRVERCPAGSECVDVDYCLDVLAGSCVRVCGSPNEAKCCCSTRGGGFV